MARFEIMLNIYTIKDDS